MLGAYRFLVSSFLIFFLYICFCTLCKFMFYLFTLLLLINRQHYDLNGRYPIQVCLDSYHRYKLERDQKGNQNRGKKRERRGTA